MTVMDLSEIALLGLESSSVVDVLATLSRLQNSFADNDGLRWFNAVYSDVTRIVASRLQANLFEDPGTLEALDVTFAKAYFSVLASRDPVTASPRCWQSLVSARFIGSILPIQFALAGMNAHINHDLAVVLVDTSSARGLRLTRDTALWRDFESLNAPLNALLDEEKKGLLTGIAGEVDARLGPVGDTIEMWSLDSAREAAWSIAQGLVELRPLRLSYDAVLASYDGTIGVITQALLIY